MDYGGRPDISTILKRWGTEHEWGGGGEGQWFHTIAAAKFILRAKTLEIASAQTRRYLHQADVRCLPRLHPFECD